VSSIFSPQSRKDGDGQVTQGASAVAPRAPESAVRFEPVARADDHAHLDRGTKISGKLSFEGPVWIDGEVDGEITAMDSVTIGESAVVSAVIHAAVVLVAGTVSGNISATHRIELRPSARAKCDLASPAVVIREGAQFEGRCSMRSGQGLGEGRVTPLSQTVPAANGLAEQKAEPNSPPPVPAS
jgi:cytoskeletal protein CcmA (bactofilin family)